MLGAPDVFFKVPLEWMRYTNKAALGISMNIGGGNINLIIQNQYTKNMVLGYIALYLWDSRCVVQGLQGWEIDS